MNEIAKFLLISLTQFGITQESTSQIKQTTPNIINGRKANKKSLNIGLESKGPFIS